MPCLDMGSDPTDVTMQGGEGLRREIGVFGLSANIINIMVGAGIFVLPALVAGRLGPSGILAYAVCAVLIAVVMLCFAETGSKVTLSGGAYTYIDEAFGRYAGFLAANLFVFGAAVTADAAVANALADSLSVPLPILGQPWCRIPAIVAMFGVLAWVNIRGVKQGIGLVKLCTFGKLTPLVLLALLGWTRVEWGNITFDTLPAGRDLAATSLLLFFAFQGAETGLNVGGEIRNPRRTVPLALLVSLSAVLTLYVLIQLVCLGVLGADLSAHTEGPVIETAGRVFGPVGGMLMLAGVAISMFGALSGEILNMPRVVFGAARDGVIPPRRLSAIHPRFATPHVAILAYTTPVVLLAVVGEFEQLALLSSASVLLIYLGVALSVVRLRRTMGEVEGAFRIPGGATVPAVAAACILWLLASLSALEMTRMGVFLVILTLAYGALNVGRIQQRR